MKLKSADDPKMNEASLPKASFVGKGLRGGRITTHPGIDLGRY